MINKKSKIMETKNNILIYDSTNFQTLTNEFFICTNNDIKHLFAQKLKFCFPICFDVIEEVKMVIVAKDNNIVSSRILNSSMIICEKNNCFYSFSTPASDYYSPDI